MPRNPYVDYINQVLRGEGYTGELPDPSRTKMNQLQEAYSPQAQSAITGQVDKEVREKQIEYVKEELYKQRIPLALGGLSGLVVGLAIYKPNEYAQVLNEATDMFTAVLNATGEIVKGIGEIVPW